MSTHRRPCPRLVPLLVLLGLAAGACRGGSATPRPSEKLAPGERWLTLEEGWTYPVPPPGSAGMPAADGAGVALSTGRTWLMLLDPAGNVQWRVKRTDVRDVAPLLTADLVVAPTEEGAAAFDRASGRLRWEATVGERVNTPVVAAGRAVATTWEGSLVAFDLADGQVAWRTSLGGKAFGPGAFVGSVVVATFDTGRAAGVVAVDAVTGRPRWTVPVPPDGVSSPAVAGDVVVVVAGDAAVHGFAVADGAPRWLTALEGSGSPEVPPLPQPDGSSVLVPHRLGGMALLQAADGTVLWHASAHAAAVRGGPAGPGPKGFFAMPLNDGRMLLAAADNGAMDLRTPPSGLVSGVAAGPGGLLIVGTAQGRINSLMAMTGW